MNRRTFIRVLPSFVTIAMLNKGERAIAIDDDADYVTVLRVKNATPEVLALVKAQWEHAVRYAKVIAVSDEIEVVPASHCGSGGVGMTALRTSSQFACALAREASEK